MLSAMALLASIALSNQKGRRRCTFPFFFVNSILIGVGEHTRVVQPQHKFNESPGCLNPKTSVRWLMNASRRRGQRPGYHEFLVLVDACSTHLAANKIKSIGARNAIHSRIATSHRCFCISATTLPLCPSSASPRSGFVPHAQAEQ